jgi:hypothetical protein
MSEDKEAFLSRWSRRKLETRQPEPGPAKDAAAEQSPASSLPVAGQAAAAPVELPSVDSLQGIASEYKEFLKPGVDDALKRAALKKLFHDPHFHFANMDKLDTYIDDYSIEDPIPEAMLRGLNQAKSLFLFDEEKKEAEGETGQALVPAALQPMPQAISQQPGDGDPAAQTAASDTQTQPVPSPSDKPA